MALTSTQALPFPTLVTDRLRLVRPSPEDSEAFRTMSSTLEDGLYMSWLPHKSFDETIAITDLLSRSWDDGSIACFTAIDRATGQRLGRCGVHFEQVNAQVGYIFRREAWGQGYASETARAICDWAMTLPTVWRLEAGCHPDNLASARVLEKAGFTRECLAKRKLVFPRISSDPQDTLIYARVD